MSALPRTLPGYLAAAKLGPQFMKNFYCTTAKNAVFETMPEKLRRALASRIKVVPGFDAMPGAVRTAQIRTVFQKAVWHYDGLFWVNALVGEAGEHLRAALLSTAAFGLDPDDIVAQSLAHEVADRVKIEADRADIEDNICRRARARSIMLDIPEIEAFCEECFVKAQADFSLLEKAFGTFKKTGENAAAAPLTCRDGSRLFPEGGLEERVLSFAWHALLNCTKLLKSPAHIEAAAAPLVRAVIDYGAKARDFDPAPLPRVKGARIHDPYWEKKAKEGPAALHRFRRVPSSPKRRPLSALYDPLTQHLGSGDTTSAIFTDELDFDHVGAIATPADLEHALSHEMPVGEIVLLSSSDGLAASRQHAKVSRTYATLYVPAFFSRVGPTHRTLTPIPAVVSESVPHTLQIESARATQNLAAVWLTVKSEAFGKITALCTSWIDQCLKLRLNTPYRAHLALWATHIEKIEPAEGETVKTGVVSFDPDTYETTVRLYAGKPGVRTKPAATVMQVMHARVSTKRNTPGIDLAVEARELARAGIANNALIEVRGYLLCQNFLTPEALETNAFADTIESRRRIPSAFLPKDLPRAEDLWKKACAACGMPEDDPDAASFDSSKLFREFTPDPADKAPEAIRGSYVLNDSTCSGVEPEFLPAIKKLARAQALEGALKGDAWLLSHFLFEAARGDARYRAAGLSLLLDAILAQALASGSEAAYEVMAGAAARNCLFAEDLFLRATHWFAEHCLNGRALALRVKLMLGDTDFSELPEEGQSLAGIFVFQAAGGSADPRVLPLLARTTSMGCYGGTLNPDYALMYLRVSCRYRQIALYLEACFQLWGSKMWELTFEERLKALVDRAATGQVQDVVFLVTALEVESGFPTHDIDDYMMLPGPVNDETRPPRIKLAIAAMRLRRWVGESSHNTRTLSTLESLINGDWRVLGSRDEVEHAVNSFDLWAFLGRELRTRGRELLESAEKTDIEQLGHAAFWGWLLDKSYLDAHPGADLDRMIEKDPQGVEQARQSMMSQTEFIFAHSTPFVPQLPATENEDLSYAGMIMRYDTLDAPLDKAALLWTLYVPSDIASDKTVPLPPCGPYFSEATRARLSPLSLLTEEDESSGCPRVQFVDNKGQASNLLCFYDIFWPYACQLYKSAEIFEARLYIVGRTALWTECDEDDKNDEDEDPTGALFGGRIKCSVRGLATIVSFERDWCEIAGISFDKLLLKVKGFENILENSTFVLYQASFSRDKNTDVGSEIIFSGILYGYMYKTDDTQAKRMMLN